MSTEKKRPVNKNIGVVMPISEGRDYTAEHWEEVFEIISETVTSVEGCNKPKMVSESGAQIIQETIITNLFENDLVICDVSSNNPNVLFELGVRITFDKPVIIIIDDKTDFSFDFGLVKHVKYSKGLKHRGVVRFKAELTKAIKEQLETPSSYLSIFGKKVQPTNLNDKESSILKTIESKLALLIHRQDNVEREIELKRFGKSNVRILELSRQGFDETGEIHNLKAWISKENENGNRYTGEEILTMINENPEIEYEKGFPRFRKMNRENQVVVIEEILDRIPL